MGSEWHADWLALLVQGRGAAGARSAALPSFGSKLVMLIRTS